MALTETNDSLIVAYDDLSSLPEDKHKMAFINAFQETFDFAKSKFGLDKFNEVMLFSDAEIEFNISGVIEKYDNFFIYEFDAVCFFKNLETVSLAIYNSENFEVRLKIFNINQKIDALICADPVYFRFIKKNHRK